MCKKAAYLLSFLILAGATANGEEIKFTPPSPTEKPAASEQTLRIRDLRVDRLLDDNGAVINGHPTRHYWYRTTYTVIDDTSSVAMDYEILEDVWATTAIDVAPLEIPKVLATPNDWIEALVSEEQDKVRTGVPLRQSKATRVSVRQIGTETGAEQQMAACGDPNGCVTLPRLSRARRAIYRR